MDKFRFEIQNCIKVVIMAKTKEEARMELINTLDDYAEQMIDGSCYVSDGELIETQRTGVVGIAMNSAKKGKLLRVNTNFLNQKEGI